MGIRAICCVAMLVGVLGQAQAQDDRPHRRGRWRHHWLERFDTDGDGQLSDQERAAARDAFWDRMNIFRGPDAGEIDFERVAKELKKWNRGADEEELVKKFRDALENGDIQKWLDQFRRPGGGRGGNNDRGGAGGRKQKQKQKEPAEEKPAPQPDPPAKEKEEPHSDPLVDLLDKLDSEDGGQRDKPDADPKRAGKKAGASTAEEEDEDETPLDGPPAADEGLGDDDLVISPRDE